MNDITLIEKYIPNCIDWLLFDENGMILKRNKLISIIRAPNLETLLKHTKYRLVKHICNGYRNNSDKSEDDLPGLRNLIERINKLKE